MLERMWGEYLKTMSHDRRELLSHFTVQDLVFKVVGVGSVGTRCMVVLLVDHMGKPLFLQLKEARPSVIAQFYKSPVIKHEGERVVQGQRMLQAASDIFLGWATGPLGRHFYFRQLRDMKLSANIELFDIDLLEGYARLCGWIMARAHAKASGQAIEVSAYIGRGDQFAEALTGYATTYADQVERDYDVFLKACRSGRTRSAHGRGHGGGFPRVAAVLARLSALDCMRAVYAHRDSSGLRAYACRAPQSLLSHARLRAASRSAGAAAGPRRSHAAAPRGSTACPRP